MSVQPKQKTPKLDPQLVNQLLSGRKTAGEIVSLQWALVKKENI